MASSSRRTQRTNGRGTPGIVLIGWFGQELGLFFGISSRSCRFCAVRRSMASVLLLSATEYGASLPASAGDVRREVRTAARIQSDRFTSKTPAFRKCASSTVSSALWALCALSSSSLYRHPPHKIPLILAIRSCAESLHWHSWRLRDPRRVTRGQAPCDATGGFLRSWHLFPYL